MSARVRNEPLAVVGIGCRFPGDADDPTSFWNLLATGTDAISRTPEDRWSLQKFYRPGGALPGKTQSQWGGYVRGIDQFDPALFGISPREAAAMDPQQRMLLEVAYRAIEDSGTPTTKLAGQPVSVFTGISSIDYAVASLSFQDRGELGPYTNTGSSSSIAANRISYCFDLRGPSVAVDTACSSSLVALHMACQSLWNGEANAALAGGVNALIMPDFYVAFSQLGVLSPDGRCKTFDASANGYARSEGAGMVMIKPLRDAQRDGDRIYCLIRATALNQDGRTPGLTVPSGEQQERLVRDTCELAGVEPSQINYVEAHGTGTAVGDPIEAGALGRVIASGGRVRQTPCRIGSVKTNIGHLEAGAGIASLIKVALSMHHQAIPPHLHFQSPNPAIDLKGWNLHIPTSLESWAAEGETRLAGINGFGYGGANGHLIVEEAPRPTGHMPHIAPEMQPCDAARRLHALPVSATDRKSLSAVASTWSDWLAENPVAELSEIAATASHHQTHHDARTLVVGESIEQWQQQLDRLAESLQTPANETGDDVFVSRLSHDDRENGIVFLCCGQGPQWWAMGQGLFRDNQVFRDCITRIDAEFQKHAPSWSLIEELHRCESTTQMSRTSIAQPALFAIQVAQAALWASVGIRPSLIIGHSVGEIAAAHLSGGLDFADACRVAIHRGRTMDLATSRGAMIAVGLTESEAIARIASLDDVVSGWSDQVAVAAVNGPASITLSGHAEAIERLAVGIENDGMFCRRLAVEYAFHSPQMDPVREELLRSLDGIETRPLHTPMVSTVTGRRVEPGMSLGGDYWWTNVRRGVRFADAVMTAANDGFAIGVELGPHPVLAFATTECYGHTSQKVDLIATAVRPKSSDDSPAQSLDNELRQWYRGIGRLFSFGVNLDWNGISPRTEKRAALPIYPMQRQSLWAESRQSRQSRLSPQVHPLLGDSDHSPTPTFRCRIDADNHAALHDHRVRSAVMFPAAAGVEIAVAAIRDAAARASAASGDPIPSQVRLQRYRLHNPMILDAAQPHHLETALCGDRGVVHIRFREHESDDWIDLLTTTRATPRSVDGVAKRSLLETAKQHCTQAFTSEECYDYCESIGLNYGPMFRGIRDGWRRDRETVATVQLKESDLDEAFLHDARDCTLHPAVLDSCFHAMVVGDECFGTTRGGLYLPFEIQDIQLNVDSLAGAGIEFPLTVHAQIRVKTDHRLLADLDLYLDDGTHVGSLVGFESRRVGAESEASTRDLIYRYRWQADESESTNEPVGERMVVFVAADLVDELVQGWGCRRDDFIWVHPAADAAASADAHVVDPDDRGSFDRLWATLGIASSSDKWHLVYLWAVDVPDPMDLERQLPKSAADELRSSALWTTRAPLNLVQSWESIDDKPSTRLTVVTLGAQSGDERDEPVAAIQMPLIGIGRVIVSEVGSLQTRLVDCDPAATTPLLDLPAEWNRQDAEDEVMLRDGVRHVHRFVPDPSRECNLNGVSPESVPACVLSKGSASGVDELRHQAFGRREPGPGEVEIEVAGAGLNFSDVMKVLDLYPGLPPGPVALGAEVSGVITAVGDGVDEFTLGEQVIAVAPGGFATHVIVNAALVAPAPRTIDLVDASALPVAWLTADHAMNTCARLRDGESILIHAASGGVGLAAIEVARELGVEIFATAGSDPKRDHLRSLGVQHVFDSRSLEFVSQIDELTTSRGDRGIDAILNSLPGEAIPAGMNLLRIGGRFLEIGKRDIYADQSLGMYPLRNNLAFFAIDLDQLFQQHAERMGRRLRSVVQKFDAGVYQAHPPKCFEASDASAAFRFMQQAKHIGKVVVDYSNRPRVVRARDDNEIAFRSDASYWLAGGLGGFGLRIADWMSASGAGTLVLSGRSKTVPAETEEVIQQMRLRGTNVVVMPCDITDPEQVQRTLDHIDADLSPLKGVLHTAMVLEDKMMVDLDRETLDRVLWPKVLGGWNLHHATRNRVLDHFVMFSSLSSVFGHAGQANYSAANALLDGLAHHRRVSGLPATVINWGHLGEVGYLAERGELSERLKRQGVLDFSVLEATECLARALHRGATQCSVLRMDWTRWRGLGLTKDVSPRFAHLIRGGGESEQSLNGDSLRQAPAAERETRLTEAVTGKLASLLGGSVAELDVDRPMLEMGLDSLMAVELRNWIEGQLQLKLQIGALMRGSSLRSLVATLNESLAEECGDGSPLAGGSAAGGLTVADALADDPAMQDRGCYPMSDQQTGLWYAFRRNQAGTAFNVFLPTRIRSPLNVDALRQSIELVVQRHASLRTTFTDSAGELQQIVHSELRPEFEVVDCSPQAMPGMNESTLRQMVIDETQRPFDLQTGPLMRLRLFRCADDDWVVVATTHHIVVDFWSLILILGEIKQSYPLCLMGSPPDVQPPQRDYFDLVGRQRQLLASERGEALKAYWTRTLADVPKVLEIPSDRIRPTTFTQAASVVGIDCPADIGVAIGQVAKAAKVTTSSVVMAALQVLLRRLSGQDKFVIGSPFAGRTHADLEDTVGFFVNMLPLMADVSGNPTFLELVEQAGDRLVDSMQHEEYPFSQIVRDLDPPRDTGRSPLIQVSCTFEKAHVREEEGRAGYLFPAASETKEIAGLKQDNFHVPHQTCHYDLEFIFEQTGDRLGGMIVYCHDLYEPDTMSAMSAQFVSLLSELVASPNEPIDSIAWQSKSDSPTTIQTTAESNSLSTLNELIEAAWRKSDEPTKSAVSSNGNQNGNGLPPQRTKAFNRLFRSRKLKPASPSLSSNGPPSDADVGSDELSQTIAMMADGLQRAGVQAGEFVPVVSRPGRRAFEMILAVQRVGGVPVPLDATRPSVSLERVLQQTAAKRVLVDDREGVEVRGKISVLPASDLIKHGIGKGHSKGTNGHASSTNRRSTAVSVQPTDPAYVIYTSGTTGVPKGVVVSHGAIANTMRWRARITPLTPRDRVLMPLSHQFDAGLGMTMFALTQGAEVVWPDSDREADMDSIVDQIIRERITVLVGVPAWVDLIASHPRFAECQHVRHVWIGGESMPASLPRLIRRCSEAQIWNCYGPTEAAVETTAHRIDDVHSRRRIPVGRPADQTDVLVLDPHHRLVPETVVGELAIVGAGLADGYLGDEALTAERFITLADGRRAYLTGDAGRRRVDGLVEVIGRLDRQTKIGGYRIEPTEVESVLNDHPAVAQSAVVPRGWGPTGSAVLIAFVQLDETILSGWDDDKRKDVTLSIRHHLAERLPPYKRPHHIQCVDGFTTTASGKVDLNALPELSGEAIEQAVQQPPRTKFEQHLADRWSDVLGIHSIGISQNFFEFGGSSLQAAMLTNRLSEDLGVDVPSSLLFDLADISAMAQRLAALYPNELSQRFGEASIEFYDDETLTRSGGVEALIAPLKTTGDDTPVFLVHPPGGIVVCYRELASSLPESQPLYAIRSRGLHGKETLPETMEAMAAEYVQAIRSAQPEGPYVIGGWSVGGVIAMEVAQQLLAAGEAVERLVLLDSSIPSGSSDLVPAADQANVGLEYGIDLTLDELLQLPSEEQLPFLWQHAEKMGVLDDSTPPEVAARAIEDLKTLFHHHLQLTTCYRMQPIATRIVLFRPTDVPFETEGSADRGWSHLSTDTDVVLTPGHHHSMVQSPHVKRLAELLCERLGQSGSTMSPRHNASHAGG